mmetsp:Transcript_99303/g.263917  ORF Transcript_99303/g.263917 Transcript_99303/m.263917 type:complete len:96 (+) Transcript_99303:86-373(+)
MGADMSYPVMSMSEQPRSGAPLHAPAWVSMPPGAAVGEGRAMPFFGGAYTSREVMPRGAASAASGRPEGAAFDSEERPRHRYGMAEPMGAGAQDF